MGPVVYIVKSSPSVVDTVDRPVEPGDHGFGIAQPGTIDSEHGGSVQR